VTFAPSSIKKAQTYLHDKTGLPWAALGITGDSAHRGGYHCGEDRVDNDDYSVDESARDRRGLSGAASALDIGSWSGLRAFSKWLVEQCKAGAEDTKDIREVIYSPDGKTVKRWDRLGVRASGDTSHLFHTHISWFRDAEGRDKTGLFRRYFENTSAPKPTTPTTPKPSTGTSDWTQELIMSLPTLRRGAAGASVKRLQGLLHAAGQRDSAIDGQFGGGTERAVKDFQRAKDIGVDGIVGRQTWTKLVKG
jgi:hypothetical protein